MNTKNPKESNAVTQAEYSFAVNLMQFLVVPTFVLNATGEVIMWNKACERLTGLEAKDVLGTRDHWRGFYDVNRPCLSDLFVHNRIDEMTQLYAAHEESGSMQHGIHAENWCVMPISGSQKYLAIDAGPIYDADGNLLAVVETLRDMTALKIAQIDLERLAVQDGLTGITNRRGLDERITIEWKQAQRDKTSIAVLMIDVDHFKRFNDIYGHPIGDLCLKQVAQAISCQVFRPSDLVARYGGEEFCVVLPSITLEGALMVANRIKDSVEALGIPHQGNAGAAGVTVSIGLACLSPDSSNRLADLLELADKALYEAKSLGRNRISFSQGPLTPKHLRILIVEDNTDLRELLVETLNDLGADIYEASNGSEAIARARQLRPTVVLMDIMMPGEMDGIEACRQIKADPDLKDQIKVIFLSAKSQPYDLDMAKRAGGDSYFIKPYSAFKVRAEVQRFLAEFDQNAYPQSEATVGSASHGH